jgi:hypothetical protein
MVFEHRNKSHMFLEHDNLHPLVGVCNAQGNKVTLLVYPSPLYLF